jgi:hypothetical protein
MKAIVAVVVVLSENRAEGLVRPVYRGDGRVDSRDAPAASSAAPLGYSPSEDGPSGPVSRRGVDDLRFGGIARTSRTPWGTATAPGLGHPRPSTSRTMPRRPARFPNDFHIGLRTTLAEPARTPKPPPARAIRPSPLSDSNRRPLPYHGSALPAELRGRSELSVSRRRVSARCRTRGGCSAR